MGDEQYPSLGFDPARGNVGTVRALARQMTDTGTYAKEAHDALRSVQHNKDVWTGNAAKAFSEKLGDLPGYLDDAHASLEQAGEALKAWSHRLEGHQKHARELEDQARQAIFAAEQADAAAQQARPDAAEQANQAAASAWDKVVEICRHAADLRDVWEDDARICSEALNEAGDRAPDTGFFDALGDAAGWVTDHLGVIGDVAGVISAVAGVLAFIPVLAPVAGPLALIAGGVALAAHGAEMVAEDKWDEPNAWVGLGGDFLGVLPGVGAVSKGMSAATDTLHVVDGLGTAASTGTRAFLAEAGQVAEPAKMFAALGKKAEATLGGNADTIAKAVQNTTSLGVQAPVVADNVIGGETTENIKDGVGYGAGAVAAGQSVGEWSKVGTGLSQLGSSLSDFARAVG